MIEVRDVAAVRAAEEEAFRRVPEGALMQRAARGLSVVCLGVLDAARGAVVGARVVLLVGSGNNGGDALWAGAMLAARGCRVDALTVAPTVHSEGAAALVRAHGRLHTWTADDPGLPALVDAADLVVDGILGIGGSGGLRSAAADLADRVTESGAFVVAVDVPSGVDADTGAVGGPAVRADITVTFGSVKPGLVIAPGLLRTGDVRVVEIGLTFDASSRMRILEAIDVAHWVSEPDADAYKYRRGVVGICAGSRAYPGAALLAVSAARRGNVGMTRFLDREDGMADTVVSRYPDVVVDGSTPIDQVRVDAWGCGPGFPGDDADALAVEAVLAAPVPAVLDAGALSVLAGSTAIRALVADRNERGRVTVITPHEGEFERIVPGLLASGRRKAAVEAARSLGAIVVLKGPGTLVASPDGTLFVDVAGTADLGTAGSGDVLTGLSAAILAGAWADGRRSAAELTEATAAAVWLHGAAGRLAGHSAPVTAPDVARAIGAAMREARFGMSGRGS